MTLATKCRTLLAIGTSIPSAFIQKSNLFIAQMWLGFLGEMLCFWLWSSFILHVKLMVSGAAPELLRKSRAKGLSLEDKFGAAPEPSGARWSTEGGSYEPLWSSSGRLHIFLLLCSTLLHLAPELLWSCSWAAPELLTQIYLLSSPLWLRLCGAAPLTINFTCKMKLLRSQKQSSSPKNPNHCWVKLTWRL